MLSEKDVDVMCPNLYEKDTAFDYSQESKAYRHFMDNVGFMSASEKMKKVLSDLRGRYEKIFVVGFSIGATIAWLCSEEKGVNGFVGFYGSRIRDYLQILPVCPTLLFFPEQEPSFNVSELMARLKEKNIEIYTFEGQHGFSDPYFINYHEKSAQQAFNRLIEFIKTKVE